MNIISKATTTLRQALLNLHALTAVEYQGVRLPPRRLRFCGLEFRSDEFYLESGLREVDRLIEHCGLEEKSSVLDIGCGPGRLAIALRHRFPELRKYLGVDVHAPSLRWCRRNVASKHQFQFLQLGMLNQRYNPSSNAHHPVSIPDTVCPPQSVDVINLFSVFSHLYEEDIRFYLGEFNRLLSPEGRVFLTAFLKVNAENPVTENPDNEGQNWSGPLHCVQLDQDWFCAEVRKAGFSICCGPLDMEVDGQTAVYLQRTADKEQTQ